MILRCSKTDAEAIFRVFTRCKSALQAQGIFQWTDSYPTLQIIEDDIQQEHLYQINVHGTIIGIINISNVQEPQYKALEWMFPEETSLVIHRLAIDPIYQGQGFAQKLMTFAENLGIQNGYISVRLDAFSQNPRVLRFYEKRKYLKQGEVYFPDRIHPFYCYEKQLVPDENY